MFTSTNFHLDDPLGLLLLCTLQGYGVRYKFWFDGRSRYWLFNGRLEVYGSWQHLPGINRLYPHLCCPLPQQPDMTKHQDIFISTNETT